MPSFLRASQPFILYKDKWQDRAKKESQSGNDSYNCKYFSSSFTDHFVAFKKVRSPTFISSPTLTLYDGSVNTFPFISTAFCLINLLASLMLARDVNCAI